MGAQHACPWPDATRDCVRVRRERSAPAEAAPAAGALACTARVQSGDGGSTTDAALEARCPHHDISRWSLPISCAAPA